jgi:uncharacterized protein YerC
MPKKGIDKIARTKFIKAVCSLSKTEEADDFFTDLMSSVELKQISRRLLAVKYLYDGKTFVEVQKEFGMGMSTINKMYFKTKGSKLLKILLA